MSERIKNIYREAGLTPPDGKGIHTEAFHRCVVKLTLEGEVDSPHAVCIASLGPEKAIRAEHRRGPERSRSHRSKPVEVKPHYRRGKRIERFTRSRPRR